MIAFPPTNKKTKPTKIKPTTQEPPKRDFREEVIQEVMEQTGASHDEVARHYDAVN